MLKQQLLLIVNRIRNFSFFNHSQTIANSDLKSGFEQALNLYISNNFKDVSFKSNLQVEFTSNHIFYIPYACSLKFEKKTFDHSIISLQIQERNFINISVAVILFAAFFSTFSLLLYFWFSISFIAFFYLIHRFLFVSMYKKIIESVLVPELLEDRFSKEQSQWIFDANKCPACGTSINKYNHECPECGIFIKKNENVLPYNSTEKYANINYIYTDDEEN